MPYARRMGFGREARRVRDASLPAGFRLRALVSCIQLAQPIGFHATLSYLEAKVQRSWREPEFLLTAMDLLEAERTVHIGISAEFARLRRHRKAAGSRTPPREHVTPTDPCRWHGDERVGARHALQTWPLLPRDQAVAAHASGRVVLAAVDSALAAPDLAVLELDELQSILAWARRQIHVVGWAADQREYRVAGPVRRLLGQLHLMIYGATPIATPWNFRPSGT